LLAFFVDLEELLEEFFDEPLEPLLEVPLDCRVSVGADDGTLVKLPLNDLLVGADVIGANVVGASVGTDPLEAEVPPLVRVGDNVGGVGAGTSDGAGDGLSVGFGSFVFLVGSLVGGMVGSRVGSAVG